MADIFISYSREDREVVAQFVTALKSKGLDVWWDPAIIPGNEFASVIEKSLADAKCVVVVWSPQSNQSRWVRDEAGEALKHAKLIPVTIDASEPPIGFRQVQAVDLTDWNDDNSDPRFKALVVGIESMINSGALPSGAWPPPLPKPLFWRRHRQGIIGAGMAGILAAAAIGYFWIYPSLRTFNSYDGFQILDPAVKIISDISYDNCLSQCRLDAACKAFSYYNPKKACFILKTYSSLKRDKKFRSGVLAVLPQPSS